MNNKDLTETERVVSLENDNSVDLSFKNISTHPFRLLLSLCNATAKSYLRLRLLTEKHVTELSKITKNDLVDNFLKDLENENEHIKIYFENYLTLKAKYEAKKNNLAEVSTLETTTKDDTSSEDANKSQNITMKWDNHYPELQTSKYENKDYDNSDEDELREIIKDYIHDIELLKKSNWNLCDEIDKYKGYYEQTSNELKERENMLDRITTENVKNLSIIEELREKVMICKDLIETKEKELYKIKLELAGKSQCIDDIIKQKNVIYDKIEDKTSNTGTNKIDPSQKPLINSDQPQTPIFNGYSQERLLNSNSNKIYKLNGVPTFKNEKELSIEDWLAKVETAFEINEVPDNKKVILASIYTKELAFDLFRDFKEKNISWVEAKQLLMKQFQPVDYEAKLLQQLTDLKQSGSLEFYTNQFKRIARKIEIPEKTLINFYINNLNTNIKGHVRSSVINSLNDAIASAYRYDIGYNKEQANYAKTDNKKAKNNHKNQKKSVQCHYCHRFGHIASVLSF
jgi:hypothetical protein